VPPNVASQKASAQIQMIALMKSPQDAARLPPIARACRPSPAPPGYTTKKIGAWKGPPMIVLSPNRERTLRLRRFG
jgi:hypothetical protein